MWWLTNFYDFSFKWIATAEIRIHPTKVWLSQLVNFKNAIWHFRRTWKKCHRNAWNASDCFSTILHQFLSGIRHSRKAENLWGMMRSVGGVRKSIHQSWLAKGLGLLYWGFKGVQEEIPSEEASTLQIGSWHFHQGNTSVHNSILVTDYLTQMGIKIVPHPPYSADIAPCDYWLFPKLSGCPYETIEEMKGPVTKVIYTFTQEDFDGAFQKSLERYKCIAAGGDYFEGN